MRIMRTSGLALWRLRWHPVSLHRRRPHTSLRRKSHRQQKYAWPVQRETGSPHWQSFEITRKLSLMCSSAWNSCVVVVVNGFVDAGLCVVFGGVAKMELSEGIRALDRKSACEVGRNYAKFEFTVVNDVENKESSRRLGAGSTHLDA